ncbi:unnamed protein product [Rotaria sp. Silwood2]|nr:unnamed protein product [Rotaria sp. Silwood2]CAF3040253.1 unnamed protein product [Rotaria sp. Silwood2]CAF3398484.1 unnamed protein product [Rotaria sp. Silwood2]CAF4189114.1 unnamed protein product [Rotaria sp. Silwood2]CAF4211691.1 unnamed protein product [Rotaria sp. Silwood2]
MSIITYNRFICEFCAGTINGDKGLCTGDIGSPLMAFANDSWVLAGIASYSLGCADSGYPGVYTRLPSFISFINSNINFSVTENTTVPISQTTTIAMQRTTTTSLVILTT